MPLDHTPLLARTGDARLVLIGEASHGTHEFYRERTEITKRLYLARSRDDALPVGFSSHYERSVPHALVDAVGFPGRPLDETSTLEPLEPASEWQGAELPETYPFGV